MSVGTDISDCTIIGCDTYNFSYTAEWLSSGDVEQLRLHGAIAIDLEPLTGYGIPYITDTATNIYLRHEEAVLRATTRPV